jgi:hypothetical protein
MMEIMLARNYNRQAVRHLTSGPAESARLCHREFSIT